MGKLKSFLLISTMVSLAGCNATLPSLGGGQGGGTVTGAAGGGSAKGENTELESCDKTLGTLSVFEDKALPWWGHYRSRYPRLGSTIPVIRLMIQQSNCFVVVERGKAMASMTKERELMNSGEIRAGSNFGKGQLVAADYTMSPSIQFSQKGTGGLGGLIGGFSGLVAGAVKKNEAATTLLLIDNRSGVQVSAAVGNAKNYDFKVFGGFFAGGGVAAAGGYTNTPEGKIITAAFADSYNQMVKALKNYKAQNVDGGLGKGGKLSVGQ
ncbi:MAG: curli biogenesis system outer membrane secretion channel CsgG [Granulosicoccus sp.]|jgi:curli biogenesis system outer membrane secretion channel CsgG